MSWKRLCSFLGLAGITLFLMSAFTALPNLLSRWAGTHPQLAPAEAIVVLGGGVYPDGVLSHASLWRALHGITLHRKGLAPLLVFSGARPDNGPAEAAVRAQLARELGVSPEMILTVIEVRTTREEAVRTETRLRPAGIRRILLVTDSQHMARARRLFERAGFEVLPAPTDDLPSTADVPEERLELMRRFLQELVARLYYRVAGYL